MPLHHSASTALLWCGTVLNNNNLITSAFSICGFIWFYLIILTSILLMLHGNRIPFSFKIWSFFLLKIYLCGSGKMYLLFVYSCLLAFRCVSLSIQQSGSSDLGYSTERQLLTTIKLTKADMTVLLFHTLQCLWSGHVEGRQTGTTGKYT